MLTKRKSLPAGYEINPVTGRKRKMCQPGKIRSEKGNCVNDKSLSKRKSKKRKSLQAGYEINALTGRKRKICPPGKIRSEKGNCVNDKSVSKQKLKKKQKSPKRKSLTLAIRTPSPKRKSIPFSMRTPLPSPNRITLSSFRTPPPKRKTPILLVKMNRRTPIELRTPKSNNKFKPSPSFKIFEKNKRPKQNRRPKENKEPVERHVGEWVRNLPRDNNYTTNMFRPFHQEEKGNKEKKENLSAEARSNILKRFKLNKY